MKILIIIIGVLLSVGVSGGYVYWEYSEFKNQEATHLIVALDITDSDLSLPSAEYIMDKAGSTHKLYGEIIIEFVLINDEEVAPVRVVKMDKVFSLLADQRTRRKELYDFQVTIEGILAEIKAMHRELRHSAIYTHINASIMRFGSGSKCILIASNLYEHTERYSVYSQRRLQKSKFEPEVYASGLERTGVPNDASGVEMIFYLDPDGRAASVYQKQAVEAYSLLFPDANITIETQASWKY